MTTLPYISFSLKLLQKGAKLSSLHSLHSFSARFHGCRFFPPHSKKKKLKLFFLINFLVLVFFFKDVLFPLDVKKIIFVDADQIVRADIKELYDMDLGNAPYAYTPFCDSRKEMDGFRFWNSGYWRNHLQGRKYHISALYVVDLKRFRKVAAGDRLRGQYQALSQDPNSLSNLDQDLPNNMVSKTFF